MSNKIHLLSFLQDQLDATNVFVLFRNFVAFQQSLSKIIYSFFFVFSAVPEIDFSSFYYDTRIFNLLQRIKVHTTTVNLRL